MANVNPQQPEIKHHPQGGELSDIGQLPFGLDPKRFPIIAEHFFGWCPVGVVAAEIVNDLRFRRQAKRQHARWLG